MLPRGPAASFSGKIDERVVARALVAREQVGADFRVEFAGLFADPIRAFVAGQDMGERKRIDVQETVTAAVEFSMSGH